MLEFPLLRLLPARPKLPPMFVVGPPRCGTTVVFQHLLNALQLAYIPNLAERHPEAPVTFTVVTRAMSSRKATYQNRYGQTDGPAGASDGWNIFERWFPRYALSPVDKAGLQLELPPFVRLLEEIWRGPFAVKNNHHSVRVSWLHEVFPRARFIHVSRDPATAALSLRDTRNSEGIAVGEWWSCPAPQFLNREFSSQLQQSAYTIVGVEEHLREALAELPEHQSFSVSYRDFCGQPERLVKRIQRSYEREGIRLSPGRDDAGDELQASNREVADASRLERFLDEARRELERRAP